MPLTMRPTGLGSGIDKDRPDYTVVTGEWEVGRIYETRGGPDNLRWFLVDDRQRSDDTLGSRGDPGGSQGAISEKLGRLEGVGEAGRGAMTRLEQRGAVAFAVVILIALRTSYSSRQRKLAVSAIVRPWASSFVRSLISISDQGSPEL
jgi:hypothetical protein